MINPATNPFQAGSCTISYSIIDTLNVVFGSNVAGFSAFTTLFSSFGSAARRIEPWKQGEAKCESSVL